ncbi:MAG: cupin [Pseudomonadota bacterium]
MRYHHLYADDAGESHWREVEITLEERSFAPPAKAIEISESESAEGMIFLRLAAGWDEPIHPTPKRQTLICTAGAVNVTASDGEVREIGQGDVWRMEDLHGKGHHTRVIGDQDFEAVVVQLS